jgi:hypothetical protein
MSLKNLFDKKSKTISNKSLESFSEDVESVEYLLARDVRIKRFVPKVDYSKPENFARYGLAERYYEDSIKRIYQTYPYDGTFYEKEHWHLSSSFLDNHMFRVDYPKSTGHALFSPSGWGTRSGALQGGYGYPGSDDAEYVYVYGGPHTDPTGDYKSEASVANIYDAAAYRESNLKIDGSRGNTVEFWLKKDGYDVTKTEKEVLFDAVVLGTTTGDDDYGRLRIEIDNTSATPFCVSYTSGSEGIELSPIGSSAITANSISDGKWHHYAFTFKCETALDASLYVDGVFDDKRTHAQVLGSVDGNIVATIGSLASSTKAAGSAAIGYGKLTGSVDEFRFWKTERTAKQIGDNWLAQVGGGSNKHDSNVDLGVYFKFNEGITGKSATDSVVLDYSGRISNGSWVGYSEQSRSTASALVDSGKSVREFEDPVIRSEHPDVVSLLSSKKEEGQAYDFENNSAIYYSLPTWLIKEQMNVQTEDKSLVSELMQVVASYFDTLHLQIEAIPKLRDTSYVDYPSPSNVSGSNFSPFSEKLLLSSGFVSPQLFADASVVEAYASRNEKIQFEHQLHDVKNFIYKNIYNNLVQIYKSKGTEKAFRNLIRCFGIDDEILKLNMYADNYTHTLKDTYTHKNVNIRNIDFFGSDRYTATIHQTASLSPYESHYISGSGDSSETGFATTMESEIFFPRRAPYGSLFHKESLFVSASLFGCHTPNTTWPDMTYAASDNASIQAYAVRKNDNSKDAFFVLKSENSVIPEITSPIIQDVYDDTKWNISFRLKPKGAPMGHTAGALDEADAYTVEFRGTRHILDSIQDSFYVTGSVTRENGSLFHSSPKSVYAGARRVNFTGSIATSTDVGISSVRYWQAYLTNEELDAHSRDPNNFGRMNPSRDEYDVSSDVMHTFKLKSDSLALHWDFGKVTGSSPSGEFYVDDLSSGSYDGADQFGDMSRRLHAGYGRFFPASSSDMVSVRSVAGLKTMLPENIHSSEMVQILDADNEVFKPDSRPINHYFSFEKSMYQTISEEMINFFATVKDFNNLIGEPVNKYRQEYKSLGKLRQMFYSRVSNTPDIDKYIEYYKWFDSAISVMLDQLKPATARFSEDIRTVIESHVLERNKYWAKFPTLEMKASAPSAIMTGIGPSLFNWIEQSAPLPSSPLKETEKILWWKERAERGSTPLADPVLDEKVNENREIIRRVAISETSGSTYVERKLSRPYRLDVGLTEEIKSGGTQVRKSPDLYKSIISFNTDDGITLTSANVQASPISDVDAAIKDKERIYGLIESADASESMKLKSSYAFPFSMYTSSVDVGYMASLSTFRPDIDITNLHHDSYGNDAEQPMQSMFTSQHVGGNAHRHVEVGITDPENRPEAYKLEISSGKIKLVHQDVSKPRASWTRDGLTKRPVNIKNIKTTTTSNILGNYQKDYEIVMTNGRSLNNGDFVDNNGYQDSSYDAVSSEFFDDYPDIPKIQRSRKGHVIVNRFAPIGGPEVAGDSNGGPGLDRESAEYSIYSSLNYRNAIVRDLLDTLSSEHTNQFGARSGSVIVGDTYEVSAGSDPGFASIHMVNRNPKYDATEGDGHPVVADYDNYWFSHPIPQSDIQYRWIKDSTLETTASWTGHTHNFSVPTAGGLSEYPADIQFITASDSNKIDFVGMNTYVNSVIKSSKNIVIPVFGAGNNLNDVLLNLNGPSGYPSWKQLRAGNHPVARNHRANNIISIQGRASYMAILGRDVVYPNANVISTYSWPPEKEEHTITDKRSSDRTTENFYDTPVSSKFKPVEVGFGMLRGEKLGTIDASIPKSSTRITPVHRIHGRGTRDVTANISYANACTTFANSDIVKVLMLDESEGSKLYQDVHNTIMENNIIPDSIVYSEVVYPREDNTFTKNSRTRVNFNNDFWRTARSDREQILSSTNVNTYGRSFQGPNSEYKITSSMWILDSREAFTAAPIRIDAGGYFNDPTVEYDMASRGEGQFQNDYSVFHQGKRDLNTLGAHAVPIYNRRFPQSYNNSVYLSGEAMWEAGTQAGKQPFYDSYENYREELHAAGKDYSLVSEFRISEHISSIMDSGGDFSAPIDSFLSLTGSSVSDSSEGNFFETYSNSDFLKYFEVVRANTEEMGKSPSKLWLKCNALLKLLPYDGFYPAQRTEQLAGIWYSEYSDIDFSGDNSEAMIGPRLVQNVAAASPCLFAPGILFNSIKSGLAVDYPIFFNPGTGSVVSPGNSTGQYAAATKSTLTTAATSLQDRFNYSSSSAERYGQSFFGSEVFGNSTTGIPRIKSEKCTRIPFEAILAPDSIRGTVLYDNEPHPSASHMVSMVSTLHAGNSGGMGYHADLHPIYGLIGSGSEVSFSELYQSDPAAADGFAALLKGRSVMPEAKKYTLASNNFFAETVNFFLKDSSLKSYVSEPGSFKVAIGEEYRMRVSILNKGTMMYSNKSAFGPPTDNTGVLYGKDHGFDPYCPPSLAVGSSPYVEMSLTATKESYTLDELHDTLVVSYSDNSRASAYGYTEQTGSSTNQDFQMQLSSSLNLFGSVEEGEIEFDENGNPLRQRRAPDRLSKRWVIQTKWESPILDFSNSNLTVLDLDGMSTAISTSMRTDTFNGHNPGETHLTSSRGMWHQYGEVPKSGKGMHLTITDVEGYSSLADIVGFAKGERLQLGELPRDGEREISEAVVAVPYRIDASGDPQFFPLDEADVEKALNDENSEEVDNAVLHQIEMMKKYVFPPQMDFIQFTEKQNIMMYVFEFRKSLSRKDVSDMWQNLPPDIATAAYGWREGDPRGTNKTEVTVGHSLENYDEMRDVLSGGEEMRWMVFKVKKRAAVDYFKKLDDSIMGHKMPVNIFNESEKRQLVSSTLKDIRKANKYSYNWPYDFFSLVELIKVSAEVEME